MSKRVAVFAALLFMLLASMFVSGCTVKAQGMLIDLEFVSSPPAYVNQPFEIMATVSGGTPPYTYQWYTKWFPPWKPGMDPAQYVASSGSEIAVPGATSATFWFAPTVEGIYWISVGVMDSAGQSVSRYPSIQPFQLIVHNTVPQISSSPSPTPPPSHIELLSPENKTYTSNTIQLIFTLTKPADWMGYSIDHQNNVTLMSNTTLSGLSIGSHSLAIYANDTFGNAGTSETIYFDLQSPELFPTLTVAVVSVIVAVVVVVSVSLIFYFKRGRK